MKLFKSAVVLVIVALALPAVAHPPEDDHVHHDTEPLPGAHAKDGSLAEVGAKLSNPISDVWALFTEFDLTFSDGDLNVGDPQVSGAMIFQPILPIPLYGKGENEWRLITRPTIPILFGSDVPDRFTFNEFDHENGLGDIQLPLVPAVPAAIAGNWILAAGPTFTFPTSTERAFGDQQFGIGPAAILGYKTKKITAVVFPQYTFGIGSRGDQIDKPDLSKLAMLYAFFYNLPDAWQFGFNPTITYNARAARGDKWNVPVGLLVAKTTKIGGMPVKFQLGAEYSVVSPDSFGKRFTFKLNVIPVIAPLIKKPIFGGG